MPGLSVSPETISQIVTLRKEGISVKNIAAQLNLKVGCVGYHLGKHDLTAVKKPDWSKEEIDFLRAKVNTGLSFKEIGQQIGRSLSAVRIRACELGIANSYVRRDYDYNKSFWDTPNPINCALAGFIAADGCVTYLRDNCKLLLNIKYEDVKYLEMMLHFMGCDNPVVKAKNDCGGYMARFAVSCAAWKEPLADIFKIIPRKTCQRLV